MKPLHAFDRTTRWYIHSWVICWRVSCHAWRCCWRWKCDNFDALIPSVVADSLFVTDWHRMQPSWSRCLLSFVQYMICVAYGCIFLTFITRTNFWTNIDRETSSRRTSDVVSCSEPYRRSAQRPGFRTILLESFGACVIIVSRLLLFRDFPWRILWYWLDLGKIIQQSEVE